MPLPVFDNHDAIPEPFRPEYEERDGKWHPKVEDVAPLKAKNAELLTETKAERKRRQELEARLAALEEETKAAASGISGEKLKEIQAQAESKYKPFVDENAKLKQDLRALRLDATVKSMLAKANAVDVNDAWAVVGGEFDLTDDGRVILKSDPTADVEKYITADLVAKKGHLFKGTQAAGGGAAGQQAGGGGGSVKPITQWTSDERATYIEKHGQQAYAALRDQHMREALAPKAKT